MIRLCALLGAILIATASPARAWQPSEAQQKAAFAALKDYLSHVDARRDEDAFAMLSPALQATTTAKSYGTLHRKQHEQHGASASRKVGKVTWYPGQLDQGTGLAVVFDFTGKTRRGKIACGFFALVEMEEGSFALQREDLTFIAPILLAEMTEAKRRELLDRPGCRTFLDE